MHPKKYLYLLFLLVALPLVVFAESDINGWRKAKWGMSFSKVKKIYDINRWEPGNPPICKMKKRVKIMGRDFAVAFYFDERSPSGKLYKVVLVHFSAEKMDSSWLNAIKEILVEKYGNPNAFDITDNMKISRWAKAEGQLKLTTSGGKSSMCAIEYLAVRKESEKL